MTGLPDTKVQQALPYIDLFYILPNLLVGSYPKSQQFIPFFNNNSTFNKIFDFLHKNFQNVLVIDLVGEKDEYEIEEQSSTNIEVYKVNWFDYHVIPLSTLIELAHFVIAFLNKPIDLSKGQNGVFIHCKHGKGRTGTLTNVVLMSIYQIDAREANQFFSQKRYVYNNAVTVESQLRYIKYWEEVRTMGENEFKIFTSQTTKFLIKSVTINNKSSTNKNLFQIKIGNITMDTAVKFHITADTKINNVYEIDSEEVTNDICVEIMCVKRYIPRSFVTFSLNLDMEFIEHKEDKNEKELIISWNDMDGLRGFPLKGKKYYNSVTLIVERITGN